MVLRSSLARDWWAGWLALGVLGCILAFGCERDDTISFDRNRPPETFITEGPQNSLDPEDPTQLFYRAHLFWRGEDLDGTVAGFRFAIDDTNDPGDWTFTTKTDSIFRFPAVEVTSLEHLFLIRAVDNLGKQDPTPDTLRFATFTTPPRVNFEQILVNGALFDYTGRDTVLVLSDITWIWTGSDDDGEIVGWESKFDNEVEFRFHARNDTTRTETDLLAGRHTMRVRAVDDAGARSTSGGVAPIQVNFDPKTTIERSSIHAFVSRPWIAFDDTLEVDVIPGVRDTLPSKGFLSFCWSATDPDGPVRDYFWSFAGQGERTDQTCATTDTLLVDDGTPSGLPILVRARDIYGQAETPSDTVFLFINYAPVVSFVDPNPKPIQTGAPHKFWFTSSDIDSDPDSLRYQWKFNNEPFSAEVLLHPDSLFVERAFTSEDVGQNKLVLKASESGGSINRTIPDSVFFQVEN
jgi:hypothetical protein